jgi:hypothetical protein
MDCWGEQEREAGRVGSHFTVKHRRRGRKARREAWLSVLYKEGAGKESENKKRCQISCHALSRQEHREGNQSHSVTDPPHQVASSLKAKKLHLLRHQAHID